MHKSVQCVAFMYWCKQVHKVHRYNYMKRCRILSLDFKIRFDHRVFSLRNAAVAASTAPARLMFCPHCPLASVAPPSGRVQKLPPAQNVPWTGCPWALVSFPDALCSEPQHQKWSNSRKKKHRVNKRIHSSHKWYTRHIKYSHGSFCIFKLPYQHVFGLGEKTQDLTTITPLYYQLVNRRLPVWFRKSTGEQGTEPSKCCPDAP